MSDGFDNFEKVPETRQNFYKKEEKKDKKESEEHIEIEEYVEFE